MGKMLVEALKDPQVACRTGAVDWMLRFRSARAALVAAGPDDGGERSAEALRSVMEPLKPEHDPLAAEALRYQPGSGESARLWLCQAFCDLDL
jgi:hypothetical protein